MKYPVIRVVFHVNKYKIKNGNFLLKKETFPVYAYIYFTLQTVQCTMQNRVLDNRMNKFLNTVSIKILIC